MKTSEYSRIIVLAQPKPLHNDFRDQRRSVYWIDRTPFAPGPNGTTQIFATERINELSKPRSLTANFKFNKMSAISPIKKSTLERDPAGRILYLSLPRRPLAKPDGNVFSSIPTGLPRQSTLDRIDMLSQPRIREDTFATDETRWGQPKPVSFDAMVCTPSSRLEDLSRPKKYHSEFKPERPVESEVPEHALTSMANQHLQKLARPRTRTMIIDDYDPYKVTSAAQHAKPTARTELLSVPFTRKQKQKSQLRN
ncbi:sperm microtubule associated protein 2-like [Mytilus trossulus]|uniref:sperm microtubule associated protein 2-like n=1 Tax=Mytilus trossulus TaxID=6551 RepID=UPI003005A5F8